MPRHPLSVTTREDAAPTSRAASSSSVEDHSSRSAFFPTTTVALPVAVLPAASVAV